jgi:hypothetical protein
MLRLMRRMRCQEQPQLQLQLQCALSLSSSGAFAAVCRPAEFWFRRLAADRRGQSDWGNLCGRSGLPGGGSQAPAAAKGQGRPVDYRCACDKTSKRMRARSVGANRIGLAWVLSRRPRKGMLLHGGTFHPAAAVAKPNSPDSGDVLPPVSDYSFPLPSGFRTVAGTPQGEWFSGCLPEQGTLAQL